MARPVQPVSKAVKESDSSLLNFGPNDYIELPRIKLHQTKDLPSFFPPNAPPNGIMVKGLGLETEVREDSKAKIREDSYGGFGLFATRNIPQGEIVGVFYNFIEIDRATRNIYAYVLPFVEPLIGWMRFRCAVAECCGSAQMGRRRRQNVLSQGCA